MAQDISIPLGSNGNYGPIQQVDASGNVLSPQNPDYDAPVITIADPTIVSAGQIEPTTYQLAGLKAGTTTLTATSTSTTPGDNPDITEVNTVTVTGPVAAALHGAFILNS